MNFKNNKRKNMVKLTWHESSLPNNLKIKQVYGVVFSNDGRILLKLRHYQNNISYSLAGGTPENFDADMIATLRRELIEEINTTIHNPVYLGYQLIEDDKNKQTFAQVRMVALVNKIGKKQPDPDTGETYDRLLTTPQNAINLLNWGEIGEKIILKAVEMAKNQLGIKFECDKDEYV